MLNRACLLLAVAVLASAHFFEFIDHDAVKDLVRKDARDIVIPCAPRMGISNHGPMPYNLRTGWWYLTCNARAEGYDGDVGLEFVFFENWMNFVLYSADMVMSNAAISLPSAPAGHRFHSFVEFSKYSTLPWYKTPINIATPNSTMKGDVNGWTTHVHGKSQQTNETFEFDLAARWGKNSVLMAHRNDTGCETYDTSLLWQDIFYHSVLSYDLLSEDDGALSRIRLPGETQWRALTGSCHYDRQHSVYMLGSKQWTWGQATFDAELPAGYERLQGAHIVWWGVYNDATLTQLSYAHLGIKSRDGPLEEYYGINVTIVNRQKYARYDVTFAYDVIIEVKEAGITLRATALVPEAVVGVPAKKASSGFSKDRAYMESPCAYRIGTGLSGDVVGTGYMEVTSGETPKNIPTDGIYSLL